MKNINLKKLAGLMLSATLIVSMLAGCSQKAENGETNENVLADNVIITETGEVIEKEEPTPEVTPTPEPTPEVVTVDPEKLVEPEQEQTNTVEEQTEHHEDKLQIVFMGDSIFDGYRDGTGIPYRTAMQCDANFYNLAIGGTTAAVSMDEQIGWEDWTSRGLLGVVNAILGNISTDIFANDTIKTILDDPNADFSKTDYFVIEYGMNDFLSAVPMTSDSRENDMKSYGGALHNAVVALKAYAPDATIILCAPTYARFFNGDWMIGDGNSVNNGYGTLFDYKGTCEYVANEQQVVFFNAYQDLGINGYTAEDYLEDGIHLTDKGRQLYADALTKVILNYEETKNN